MEETNFPIRPEHSLVDDTPALAGSMMAYPIVNMDTYVRHSVALLTTHPAHPMYQPAAFSYLYSLAQNPVDVLGSHPLSLYLWWWCYAGDSREHLHFNFVAHLKQLTSNPSIHPSIHPTASSTSIKLHWKSASPTKRTLTPFRSPYYRPISVTNTAAVAHAKEQPALAPPAGRQGEGG